MRSYNNDRGGRRDGGRFDRDRSDRPTMYNAICDKCSKRCKVPFLPSNDKPIYCSDCFEKVEKSGDRRNSQDNEMFSAVCDDCGRDCQVPFRPSGDKPIYCSKCFEKRGNGRDVDSSPSRMQPARAPMQNDPRIDDINHKLDKIIRILEAKEIVEITEEDELESKD